VILLVTADDQGQHTCLQKTNDPAQYADGVVENGYRWKIGVLIETLDEEQANVFIENVASETKSRGSSSRAAVCERTAHALGLHTETDFANVFKFPDAELYLRRVPSAQAPRMRK
jgi:hypothetical protein